MTQQYPILYSFRRCPYAMRARMGLYASGAICELREVVLRDKPAHMLEISPKGTVPVLQTKERQVIEESLEVMLWALEQSDPEGWLKPPFEDMMGLIKQNDTEFKSHLDRYKYANRFEGADALEERGKAERFLSKLDGLLEGNEYLFGDKSSLADYAIAPFIRQFAFVDKAWFDQTEYGSLQKWLEAFLSSKVFTSIMTKYSQWQEGDEITLFHQ